MWQPELIHSRPLPALPSQSGISRRPGISLQHGHVMAVTGQKQRDPEPYNSSPHHGHARHNLRLEANQPRMIDPSGRSDAEACERPNPPLGSRVPAYQPRARCHQSDHVLHQPRPRCQPSAAVGHQLDGLRIGLRRERLDTDQRLPDVAQNLWRLTSVLHNGFACLLVIGFDRHS